VRMLASSYIPVNRRRRIHLLESQSPALGGGAGSTLSVAGMLVAELMASSLPLASPRLAFLTSWDERNRNRVSVPASLRNRATLVSRLITTEVLPCPHGSGPASRSSEHCFSCPTLSPSTRPSPTKLSAKPISSASAATRPWLLSSTNIQNSFRLRRPARTSIPSPSSLLSLL